MEMTKCEIQDRYLCRVEMHAGKEEFAAACEVARQEQPSAAENDIWYEAVNIVMDKDWDAIYKEVCTSKRLSVMDAPGFSLAGVSEEGFDSVALIPVLPRGIKIEDYLGVEVKAPVKPVADREVDAQIQSVWQQKFTLKDHKGPAVRNDVAVVDYVLSAPDVVFKYAHGEDVQLTIGGHDEPLIGMADAVQGHAAGETVETTLTVGPRLILKGATGTVKAACKITVKRVCRKELEQLNDSFARRYGNAETLDGWKAQIRTRLEDAAKQRATAEALQTVPNVISSRLVAPEIPDALADLYYDRQLEVFKSGRFPSEAMFQNFLAQNKLTEEALKQEMLPSVRRFILTRIALLKIAKAENLTVAAEEIDRQLQLVAQRERCTPEEAALQHSRQEVTLSLMAAKAEKLVKEKAKVVAVPVSEAAIRQ